MNQIELALRSYESTNGHLPPAYVLGPDGKPWHSWRVLILPYLEEQQAFAKYRFDEPWNGPNNRTLEDKINTDSFQCPSSTDFGRTRNTNYLVVVGDGTAFPGDKTTKFADFRDGVENTVLLVEAVNSDIHWMEPRDLEFDSLSIGESSPDAPAVSCPHSRGPGVVFADHITCYPLQQPFSAESLRALTTIAGGESVTRDSLLDPEGARQLRDIGNVRTR